MILHLRYLVFLSLFLLSLGFSNLGPPEIIEQSEEEEWFEIQEHSSPRPLLKCHATANAQQYVWLRNGEPLEIDGTFEWVRRGQSGSIAIVDPKPEHQGYYQCFVSNIFGTAVSNVVHLRLGVLEHFPDRPLKKIDVLEGNSLTLECQPPKGNPEPSIFWLYRDTEDDSVIETIKRRHITVDVEGRLHFSHVERNDGRKNLIYECAATSPVLHGEYRSGDHFQLNVIPRKSPMPTEAEILFASEQVMTVRAGNRLKIQCIFAANPTPTVFWTKIDGDLAKNRIRDLASAESDYGKSLIVDNIHPQDAGIYECAAGRQRKTFNIRVLASPFWEIEPPKNVAQSEGTTVDLNCLASGQPAPLVTWSMNGKPLHELSEDPRRLVLDNGRVLRLQDLRHDVDTGVYQCNASSPLGYVYANAFVHVKAHAPRFLMPADRIWKVVVRSTVELNCDVEAAPEAVVRWVDSQDIPLQVIPSKTQLYPNNTFVINDVNTADEGIYYCNVSNKYGIARATNKIKVFKPTYFVRVPSPKRLVVEAGNSTEIFCEAVADPRLILTYKWTLNGKQIVNSTNFLIYQDRLVLKNLRGKFSGIIDCAAMTEVDVKLASMQLIVKDVPANPSMENFKCTERKAILRWKPSEEHGDALKKYVVEMSTTFKPNEWELVSEEFNVNRAEFESDITLTPWVNYTFRVIAVNSYGRSDLRNGSDPEDRAQTVECHTRPSFPYTNPKGVKAQGNEPNNLIIFWEPMNKYYWNGPNLQYLVRYKQTGPHHAWTEFLVEDSLANHTIIRDQPTFREYDIEVRAVNAMGQSLQVPETHRGFSGEDAPELAPENFRLVNVHNFSAVEFVWDKVEPETVRGFFQGYEIEYWRTEDPSHKTKILVPPKLSTKVLNTLNAHANYSVLLRARNKLYSSPPTEIIQFETPEGVPSKVDNLRVIPVGSFSILVEWASPRQPNGLLRGYFLSFISEHGDTEETYVLYKKHHYLFEKALPDTAYKVSVWGETKAGEGPKVTRPVRTWQDRDPDPPMFDMDDISLTSAIVNWQPSNNSRWKYPGSSFYVNYTLVGSEVYKQSAPIYLPETKIELEGLEESSKYEFFGVARDGSRSTIAEPQTFKTKSSDTEIHLDTESLRTAAWFIAILVGVAVAVLTVLLTCCCERRGNKFGVTRKCSGCMASCFYSCFKK